MLNLFVFYCAGSSKRMDLLEAQKFKISESREKGEASEETWDIKQGCL